MKRLGSLFISIVLLICFSFPLDYQAAAFSILTDNKSITTAETSASISIDRVTGNSGETISVPIRIDNNPGIIALSLKIAFDTKQLKLLEVQDGNILRKFDFTHSSNFDFIPFILNWDDYGINNNTENGILAILKFQLSDSFQDYSPISLEVNKKSTVNADLEEVSFLAFGGSVTLSQPITSTVATTTIISSFASSTKTTTTSSVTHTTSNPVSSQLTTTFSQKASTTTTTILSSFSTSTVFETSSNSTTTNSTAPSDANIVIDDMKCIAGEDVLIPIRIENNPGIIALSLNVVYDNDKMELVRVVDKGLFDSAIFTTSKNLTSIPYILNWDDDPNENNTGNGVVALLEFKIKEDAFGDVNIIIQPNRQSIFDKDLKEVAFGVKNGKVSIISKGDVDCDGAVKISDAVLLLKYITELEGTELSEDGYPAADLDNDSLLTMIDVQMLLKKFCYAKKEAENFSFDKSNVTIYQSETCTINTSNIPQGTKVYWKSSDEEIATVSDGIVSGIKPGNAQITAYFDYDGERYSQICDLTVNPIEIRFKNNEDTLYINDTLQLQVETKPENLDVFWTVSDPSIISVTNGLVTGKSSGQAFVSVIASYDGPPLSVSREITVKKVKVSLSEEEISMIVGDSATLSCETSPNALSISWTSNNNEIVLVKEGTISAIKPGKAVITASVSYKGRVYSASCAVSVTEPTLSLSSYADTANRDVWDSTHIPDGVACGWNVYYPQATYPKGGSIKWSLVLTLTLFVIQKLLYLVIFRHNHQ